MNSFSQGTLEYLNKEYYIYALLAPRTNNIFYIGKGKNDRVFQHELANSGLDTEKLNIIAELKSTGLEVMTKKEEVFGNVGAIYNAKLDEYYSFGSPVKCVLIGDFSLENEK